MDADERLMALKRAYADIILNTAKEAAARIMVSERKALRFECELKNAKEDAVQMLLRLKQMMDSKISEAKMTSCTQQKKIEELEAQLQEAEDIVKDLREELKAVQAELERFPPSKEVKHPVRVIEASEENRPKILEAVVFPPTESQPTDVRNSNIDQRNKRRRFCYSLYSLKKCYNGNPDLPSIILRNKETELCRNGCTQRIRACEWTPTDREMMFSEQRNDVKPESIAREDEACEKFRKAPSLGAGIVRQVEVGESRKKASPYRKERTLCLDQPLDQVKEIVLTADNSCVMSPGSVKNTNDTAVEENSNEAQVDLPLESLKSKAFETSGVPSRVIKYTFQRKRKRGTLTDGNGYNGKSENLKRKEEENRKGRFEAEKANSIEASTPEKIRLEQVARQLISLSDKKWWR